MNLGEMYLGTIFGILLPNINQEEANGEHSSRESSEKAILG